MPLPTGTWHMNLNGTQCELQIAGVDPNGVVQGSLHDFTVKGFWNDSSQCLTFMAARLQNQEEPYYFRALLFSTPPQSTSGQDLQWTLVGTASDPIGTGGTLGMPGMARRNEFGWFAQITQVV